MANPRLLCIDCKHIKVNVWSMSHPDLLYTCKKSIDYISVNVVTGEPEEDLYTCARLRATTVCGSEGKLWTPREPSRLVVFINRIFKGIKK